MTRPATTLKPYAPAREVAGMERPARDANLKTLAMTGKVLAIPVMRNAPVPNMAKDARNLPKTLAMTMKVPVMVPTRNAPVPRGVRTALKRNQGNDIRPIDQGFPHIFQWVAITGGPFLCVGQKSTFCIK